MAVKLDLIGSIQQAGLSNARLDYAQRLCEVDGLSNVDPDTPAGPNTDLRDALNQTFNRIGVYHPTMFLMPLTLIRAKKIGKNVAKTTAIYRRGRWSVPPQPAFNTASWITARQYIDVYRIPKETSPGADDALNGIPNGPWAVLANPLLEKPMPMPYRWPRPFDRITVRTVLSFNPSGRVKRLEGKINSDRLTFGDIELDPWTVRFDGTKAVWSQAMTTGSGAPPSSAWAVEYQFTHIADGHYRQFPYYSRPPLIDLGWQTENILEYESDEFQGNFPVHS